MSTTTSHYAFNSYTTINGAGGTNAWTNPTGPLVGGSGVAYSNILTTGVGPKDYLAYGWAGTADVPLGATIESIDLMCTMSVQGTSGVSWQTDVKMESGSYSPNGTTLFTTPTDIGADQTTAAWGLSAANAYNLVHNQVSSTYGIRILLANYSAYGGSNDILIISRAGITMAVTYSFSASLGSGDILKAAF